MLRGLQTRSPRFFCAQKSIRRLNPQCFPAFGKMFGYTPDRKDTPYPRRNLRMNFKAFIKSGCGLLILLVLIVLSAAPGAFAVPSQRDIARWKQEAAHVTIIRDDWGIAHVYGKTDADAVFGAEYAQAEDDFNRVETNYINAMGRLAEAEGQSKTYQDLRMKLFIDPATLKKQYAQSPEWLKKLMNAFADGLNFYLF